MKWSVSQGKYVEDTSSGTGAGTEDAVKKMKQLYALQILKAAKKPADIVTAFSLLEPSAAELKAQENKKNLETEKSNKLSDIDRALTILQGKAGKKVKTGPIAGIALKIKTKFGGGSPQERELYNLLSGLAAEKMFSVGGKALTGPERQILAPLVPSAGYGNQTNVTNLQELRNKVTGLYDAYQPGTETAAPSYTDQYTDNGDFLPQ